MRNIECNCLPEYCQDYNCSLKQKNRTFATVNLFVKFSQTIDRSFVSIYK